MSYRDDRDALRSEVDTLNQELDAARADQERYQHIEERLEAAKREMAALEAELAKTRKKPKAGAASAAVVPLVAFLVIGALGGAVLVLPRRGAEPPPIAVAPAPVAVKPVPPRTPAPTERPPAPKPLRTAQASWSATVTKSEGIAVPRGSRCTITATVVPDSSGMHVTDVTVSCGGRVLYDQSGPLNGVSQTDSDARQRAGSDPSTWVYQIIFSDAGTRASTRNQAKLDSTQKIGRIWSENLPDFRVDLAIEQDSAPASVGVAE